ncbi:MAG: hypothetical protein JXA66_08315 [Oligoflexia bacterium]|nr:hypothetical protein [Oligoflexia bacterium]
MIRGFLILGILLFGGSSVSVYCQDASPKTVAEQGEKGIDGKNNGQEKKAEAQDEKQAAKEPDKGKIQSETYVDETGQGHKRLFRYGFQSEKSLQAPSGSSQVEQYVDENGVTRTRKFKYGFQYEPKKGARGPMLDTSPKPSTGFQKSKKTPVATEEIKTKEKKEEEIPKEEKDVMPQPDFDEIKSQVEQIINSELNKQ